MNFYTSTYDLNNPTTTQVNVPTNTDYKIGLKFRRNGEIQDLNPNEVMLGTLSADAEKTNGYITFTTEAGDNANFSQLPVIVETEGPSEFGPTQAPNLQKSVSGTTARLNFNADLSSLVGQTLYAKNVILEASTDNGTTWEPIDIDMSISFTRPYFYIYGTTVYTAVWANGKFYTQQTIGGEVSGEEIEYFEIPANCRFISSSAKGSGYLVPSYPAIVRWRFLVGEPQIKADFKLNINEFKSQCGDLNPKPTEFETVNFAGTDGDGNAFSYDIVIK